MYAYRANGDDDAAHAAHDALTNGKYLDHLPKDERSPISQHPSETNGLIRSPLITLCLKLQLTSALSSAQAAAERPLHCIFPR